jgi:hypothetical protein
MTEPKIAVASPAQIRAEFVDLLRRDWLGPAGGDYEVVYEASVRDRYLVGALAPNHKATEDEQAAGVEAEEEFQDPFDEQGELAVGGMDSIEDGVADALVPEVGDTAAFIPSALGITVLLAEDAQSVIAEVRYGRYERHKDEASERPYWQRVPVQFVSKPIPIKEGLISQIHPERGRAVHLIGVCRRYASGGFALTLFLVNGQGEPKKFKDQAWVFQPEIHLYAPDGSPIFAKRPFNHAVHDAEDSTMAMLYRETQEFAIGHGVGVHVEASVENPARALHVSTKILPVYEVPPMQARTIPKLVTDMAVLGNTVQGNFSQALAPLTNAYRQWLEERQAQIAQADDLLRPYVEQGISADQIRKGWIALERIQAGIELLDNHSDAARAFQFANAAMALQRIHTLFAEKARRGAKPDINELDTPENHSWRPFQLAFILLNLPSMVYPDHPDRVGTQAGEGIADLLWFPTGGGKTEAYLGLTAFTLGIRRLQGNLGNFDGHGEGVAVIMRYTLRLLTLQQFQRATALIAACEVLRRQDEAAWGIEPFRIGLWVGSNSTPNYTEDSAKAISQERGQYQGKVGGSGTPIQLKHCPWCGSPIHAGKNIIVETAEQGVGRTLQYCSDSFGECPFGQRRSKGEGLPIVVVDEEIYRRLPALLIATVDKFAQMPWKGATQMLFGRVTGWCPRHGYRSPEIDDADSHPKKGVHPACKTEPLPNGLRPPDLIIQDELHLISGPLGTLVGLYETAIDALCTWQLDGKAIRPKVVASTATVRRAAYQVHGLFQRDVAVFPPSGLDARDNFFAHQDKNSSGRLYLGICASGTRLKSVLIRAYVTAMAAAQTLFDRYGAAADPYMTMVGYFNSIRELGGMLRVMDDAVQSRLRRMDQRGLSKRYIQAYTVDELTSRKSAVEIPEILDRLETPFGASDKEKRPLDAVLATNMISVGVDVGRLGAMIVAGQPKATAEYIQATSRVGRRAPGVVITVYNWTRPRDLSHYERFEHYHATFYQQVEALSVTPFSIRALDRALSAVFVSLIRLHTEQFNPEEAAGKLQRNSPIVQDTLNWIIRRAKLVTQRDDMGDEVLRMLNARLDEWLRQTRLPASQLTYSSKRGAQVKLLNDPQERMADWQIFTCLNSMRDVEAPVRLILDDYRMDDER